MSENEENVKRIKIKIPSIKKKPKKFESQTEKKEDVSKKDDATKNTDKDLNDKSSATTAVKPEAKPESNPELDSEYPSLGVNTKFHYRPDNVWSQVTSNINNEKNINYDSKPKKPQNDTNSKSDPKDYNSEKNKNSNQKHCNKTPQNQAGSKNPKNLPAKRDEDKPKDKKTPNQKGTKKETNSKPEKEPGKKPKKGKSSNRKSNIPESVNLTTCIVIDMHGKDPRFKNPLNWVPVIRDSLYDALHRKVDYVRFITGKGLHSKSGKPFLKPLVLLTTKRLGFDSHVDEKNEGNVICDISSYKDPFYEEEKSDELQEVEEEDEEDDRAFLFQSFGVGKYTLDINKIREGMKNFEQKKRKSFDDDDYDEYDDDDRSSAFVAVKREYPAMPDICVNIICESRTKNEALEFAYLFEEKIEENDLHNSRSARKKLTPEERLAMKKKEQQTINEMKLAKKFQNIYHFDYDVIQRVVQEFQTYEMCDKIFRKIKAIPPDFHEYIGELFFEYKLIPIKTLLKVFKVNNYNISSIVGSLLTQSMNAISSALNAMKVDDRVMALKEDGTPKFVPEILLDLSEAGVEKATSTIERIMNGLENGTFSDMILKFGKKPNRCSINDVQTFIKDKANEDKILIRRRRENDLTYHYTISKKDQEEESSDDYSDSDDDFRVD